MNLNVLGFFPSFHWDMFTLFPVYAAIEKINALPSNAGVTDKTAVEAARKAYNALTDDQKKLVSADVVRKLTGAETKVTAAVKAAAKKVKLNDDCVLTVPELSDEVTDGQRVIVSMRPNEFQYADKGLDARVISSTFLGQNMSYKVEFTNVEALELEDQNEIDEPMNYLQRRLEDDEVAHIVPMADKVNVFTEDGERSLIKGVKAYGED